MYISMYVCVLCGSIDYDIGHSIRTCIIPEAVLWYTGEAMEDDGDDEDGEYDEVQKLHRALFAVCCVTLQKVLSS